MRRAGLWIALCGLAGFLRAENCACPPASTQEQYDLATVVFQGKLVELPKAKKGAPQTLIFTVDDAFKGDPDMEITLVDDAEGQTCAIAWERNKGYLVYTRWDWGRTWTSRCAGTKALTEAEVDRAVIGPGNTWKGKLYPKLRQICMGRYDTACCLQSISAMEKGFHLPEPERGCPEGMRPNVVACKGSVRWCQPF